jgi:DNA-binding NtrC family response regulator
MSVPGKIKILILDDEKHFTDELHEYFRNSGFEAFEANTIDEARSILIHQAIDLLILDVRLPGVNGLDILKEVKDQYPEMEVIVVSAHGDMDTVIKAMRLGAFDYLRKPFRHIDIQIAIKRTQKYLQLQSRLKFMEEKNSLISKNLEARIERQFIGVSTQMHQVFEQALAAAKYSDANVLITGESGVGKENIARIIHYSSERKDQLFCDVNCSSISETLLESEFFGHKRGAFTGAVEDKMGYFEASDQGTLFLDEIADMPLSLQSKILRAIQEKVIKRVGDIRQIPVDFRIISATNQDIEKNIEEKKFRLDLYYRLNTLHIHIPPLRERPEDIRPLLLNYIERYALEYNKPGLKVNEEVYDNLMNYDFPGNIRELRNLLERAVILCKGNTLTMKDFPVLARNRTKTIQATKNLNLEDIEKYAIREALQNNNFNQLIAAGVLGISRDALIRRMKKYNISVYKTDNLKCHGHFY